MVIIMSVDEVRYTPKIYLKVNSSLDIGDRYVVTVGDFYNNKTDSFNLHFYVYDRVLKKRTVFEGKPIDTKEYYDRITLEVEDYFISLTFDKYVYEDSSEVIINVREK